MSFDTKKAIELLEQAIAEERKNDPSIMMSMAEAAYSPSAREHDGLIEGMQRALTILTLEDLPPISHGRQRNWSILKFQRMMEGIEREKKRGT